MITSIKEFKKYLIKEESNDWEEWENDISNDPDSEYDSELGNFHHKHDSNKIWDDENGWVDSQDQWDDEDTEYDSEMGTYYNKKDPSLIWSDSKGWHKEDEEYIDDED